MPVYTRTDLKSRVNAGIKGKNGMLVDFDATINDAVREVLSEIDVRSTRRKANLSPNLFTNVFTYSCPTDLKGYGIIAINPQAEQTADGYDLVPFEEFSRNQEARTVAIQDNDLVRKILISAQISDISTTVSTLDTLTAGGGTWALFGDGTNLTADSDNYIKESGSINWDISSAGGTTAGIQNSGLNVFDITDYLQGNGSLFVFHYITSATNITNYILRVGSSASDYYSKTITAQNDGTAFRAGWNLLRFDLTSLTTTGTPVNTACNFIALYMTKTAGKVSETDYRFDSIMLKRGKIHELFYYSNYGWQDTSGTYLENSTADADYLNCDAIEFRLFVEKGIALAAAEVDESAAIERAEKKYYLLKDVYQKANPSEAKYMTSDYADFITT